MDEMVTIDPDEYVCLSVLTVIGEWMEKLPTAVKRRIEAGEIGTAAASRFGSLEEAVFKKISAFLDAVHNAMDSQVEASPALRQSHDPGQLYLAKLTDLRTRVRRLSAAVRETMIDRDRLTYIDCTVRAVFSGFNHWRPVSSRAANDG